MGPLDLGIGLALMPGLVDHIDRVAHLVDYLEVEPQTFWLATDDPAAPHRLDADAIGVLRNRPGVLLAHGVSAPVGGSRLPEPAMAELFRETVHRLDAVLASEHLSFNQAEGPEGRFGSAFFLPPCATPAGVDAAVAAIDVLRSGLAVPFSVETPVSYLRPRRDEMPDSDFVAAVATSADCGILLDLHNIWANQRNGRQDVRDFVSRLPLERVAEVHLAGGMQRGKYWLDAHCGRLDPELLDLAEEILPQLPALRAVTYEVMPEFLQEADDDILGTDLQAVHRVVERATRRRSCQPRRRPQSPTTDVPPSGFGPQEWEDALAGLAIGQPPDDPASAPLVADLADDPGVELLQELVHAGRCGRVASALPLTIGLLIRTASADHVDHLLVDYASVTTPGLWGSDEGRRFAAWLEPRLDGSSPEHSALALDVAGLDAVRTGQPVTVEVAVDPMAIIRTVHEGAPSDGFERGRFAATVDPG